MMFYTSIFLSSFFKKCSYKIYKIYNFKSYKKNSQERILFVPFFDYELYTNYSQWFVEEVYKIFKYSFWYQEYKFKKKERQDFD